MNNPFKNEDIVSFIIEKTGCNESEIKLDADIDNDLGCSGDDFHELIGEYAKEFNVDLSSYLWYFHTDEEGSMNNIGGVFLNLLIKG